MRFALLFLFFCACASETPDPPQAPSPPADSAAQTFAAGRALQTRGLFTQASKPIAEHCNKPPLTPNTIIISALHCTPRVVLPRRRPNLKKHSN